MEKIYEFLKTAGTYYLATVEGDQPRVRPFGTIDCYKDRLYIQTGLSKDVAKQMLANPRVELCAFDGQEWLRLAATAVWDEDIAAQCDQVLWIPEMAEPIYVAIPAIVHLQLLARFVSVDRDRDVDKPRNLAKSVTVE